MTSYNAVHGTNFSVSDVTKIKGQDLGIVDTDKYTYLMTYSYPCQDLSVAGKQAGMKKGSGTRSGLLWEVERLLNECEELPQILLMENVPQVHSEENKADFYKWIDFLESKGYSNNYKDLNAKNYGIPQNRDRCFMVSVLNTAGFVPLPMENFLRVDYYDFPNPFELKLKLKDMLEDNVDEKYYIGNFDFDLIKSSPESLMYDKSMIGVDKKIRSYNDFSPAIPARDYKEHRLVNEKELNLLKRGKSEESCIQVGNLTGGKWDKVNETNRRVYSEQGCSPTISTCQGGQREPKIMVEKNISEPIAYDEQNKCIRKDGTVGCLTTDGSSPKHNNRILEPQVLKQERTEYGKSIRKEYESGNIEEKRKNMTRMVPRNDSISNTLTSVQKDNYLLEPMICASRGRNDLDGKTKQRIEVNDSGCSNSLTTVQKDNYLIEPNSIIDDTQSFDGTRIYKDYSPSLRANRSGLKSVDCDYRIRKLTPKECWRLMGFDDDDFEKAQKLLNETFYKGSDRSTSQLYKQAGNSIVVNVLEEIFKKVIEMIERK